MIAEKRKLFFSFFQQAGRWGLPHVVQLQRNMHYLTLLHQTHSECDQLTKGGQAQQQTQQSALHHHQCQLWHHPDPNLAPVLVPVSPPTLHVAHPIS